MSDNIDQKLDDILNIESDIKKETQVVKLPTRHENMETDYKYARENLYDLVERGQDAIDGILQLSKETEHPRAYEVAGQLIKTVGETAEKLIDLQQKLKKLEGEAPIPCWEYGVYAIGLLAALYFFLFGVCTSKSVSD